jgi:hypothetical protein
MAIMQTNKKYAFLRFIFNFIGYDIKTATISLALIIIKFLVISLPIIYAIFYPIQELLCMNYNIYINDISIVLLMELLYDGLEGCLTYLRMLFFYIRLMYLFNFTLLSHKVKLVFYLLQLSNLRLLSLYQINLS